jgi:hypothetical protein
MARLGPAVDGSRTPITSQRIGDSLLKLRSDDARGLWNDMRAPARVESEYKLWLSGGLYMTRLLAARVGILAIPLLVPACIAQEPAKAPEIPVTSVNTTLPVNWIYGAYIPKGAPMQPLTGHQRFKLYLRQTYTTPGIYVKTALFSIHDQVNETEPDWGDGASGFAKRVGSLQAGNIIQNSLTALGNAAVGFEPRYDRCRSEGTWPRIRHAVVRNIITYGGRPIHMTQRR